MKITFVRHGQTDWNKEGKQQGTVDIPLNETGIEQARETAALLKDEIFDCIYTSPLLRAHQTAQIIGEGRNIPIILDDRLIERYMGEFEGKSWKDFDSYQFWDYTANIQYKRAENIRVLFERVYNFFDELKGKQGSVLVVSHGGVFAPVSSYSGRSKKEDNLTDILLKNAQTFTFEI